MAALSGTADWGGTSAKAGHWGDTMSRRRKGVEVAGKIPKVGSSGGNFRGAPGLARLGPAQLEG